MDEEQVALIDLRKHAVDCKLIVVFAEGTCHIVLVVAGLVLFSHNRDMMVSAVHSRTHQVYRACVNTDVLLVGMLLVDRSCHESAVRSQHEAAKKKKGGYEMDTYYNPEDLAKFGTIGEKAPELAEKFFSYYNAVFEEGALTAREKSLIALAVAHTVQCPYCIDAYTNDCLNKGVTEEQMTEAVHVAAAIRGGASLVHGVQMKNIVKKLEF